MNVEDLYVKIPIPTRIPISRGRNSTGGVYGIATRIRISGPEKDIIDEAAKKQEMTRSMFLRFCGVEVARRILGRE